MTTFATIIKAVATGRNVYANIRNAIVYLLGGNLSGIITVLVRLPGCVAGAVSAGASAVHQPDHGFPAGAGHRYGAFFAAMCSRTGSA